jgi:hypothetical protein
MASNDATFDRDPAEGPRTTPPPGREGDTAVEREEPKGRASRGTISQDDADRGRDPESAYTPPRDEDRTEGSNNYEHRPRRNTM